MPRAVPTRPASTSRGRQPRRTAPLRAVSAAALLLAPVLAGCGQSTDDARAADDSSSTTRAAAPSASDPATSSAPTSSPASSSPSSSSPSSPAPSVSASATAAPRQPAPLAQRLLPAGRLPGFNQEYRWTPGRTTRSEPTDGFGTCQRFALTSIGATSVVVRGYRPAASGAPDTAGELVADFPDAMTPRRAFAVLTSWRAKCADRLSSYATSDVGALQDVPVPGGRGGWYLLRYGPAAGDADAQYFDAQGLARVGSRIALVELVAVGQDYDYEPGHEPMVAAVRRAAARLT